MLASLNLVRVLLPDLLAFRRSIRWDRMKQLAKDYRDFPMYSASQNVINALSSGLPVLLLTHFYGIAVAGAYAFGVRILQVPMGFVLRALRQVLFQKAGETQHQGGSLAPLYVKITAGLFALAFFPSLVLFIWAPQIFTWIFGSQWHTAGEFARSLMLWLMFDFCNLPAVLFARLIRIQRTVFLYDLVLLAAKSVGVGAGWAVSKCIADHHAVFPGGCGHEPISDPSGGLCCDEERRARQFRKCSRLSDWGKMTLVDTKVEVKY